MGVSWVNRGNHSIAAGIIQGAGTLIPESVTDISNVYDYVRCDGRHFIRSEDSSVIAPVRNAEFAAIFEIGRMMRDNHLSF